MVPVTPSEIWDLWIQQIAADPEMDLPRLLEHLQVHVSQHIPEPDASRERWRAWLAGTYNLLAILSHMVDAQPSYELGVSRLFQKWRQHATDHTPPPAGLVDTCRELHESIKFRKDVRDILQSVGTLPGVAR